ncbi:MAG: hypothetical protein JSS83_18135 [Cyanobacteria bacterium SZAS LIN-3]|nr:hypothetical protein [Cyanobacteria bacterium SZAS LIN-3]
MITPKNLKSFLRDNNYQTVLQECRSMSEAERLTLGKAVLREFNSLIKEAWATDLVETGPWIMTVLESTKAALFYCGEFAQIKTVTPKLMPLSQDFIDILRERKPEWLDQWCSYCLKKWPWETWEIVYQLENLCVNKVEHNVSYYQALVFGLAVRADMEQLIEQSARMREVFYDFLTMPQVVRSIGAPHAVLQELWRAQFMGSGNFPGDGLVTYSSSADTLHMRWAQCISALVEKGIFERQRLIDGCFQNWITLAESQKKRVTENSRDESPAPFLIALHDALVPDAKAYSSNYASLVGATHTDVATFALSKCLQLPVDCLSVEEILFNIPMTFRNREKAPAQLALQVLDRLASIDGTIKDRVAHAVIEAFNHKSKGIHAEAIELLASRKLCEGADAQARLKLYLDRLEGTNRSNAAKLVQGGGTANVPKVSPSPVVLTPQEIPEGLDETFCKLAGIPGLSAGLNGAAPATLAALALAPVDCASMLVPRLYEDEKLKPIDSLDDLVFQASAAVKAPVSIEKMELMLDGIARLGPERSDDFRTRTANLKLLLLPFNCDGAVIPAVPLVIYYWLFGNTGVNFAIYFCCSPFHARCLGLAARLCAGLSLPMLAAPTHSGGWIDPVVLVERVLLFQSKGRLLQHTLRRQAWDNLRELSAWLKDSEGNAFYADTPEFIQALLRLAPDNRSAALSAAASVEGDYGRALRYALGEGAIEDIESAELALAAFRCRYPKGTCQPLAKFIHAYLPDGVTPAKYTFNRATVDACLNDHYRSILRVLPDFLSTESDGHVNFPVAAELGNSIYASHADQVNREIQVFGLYPTISVHNGVRAYYEADDISIFWLQNQEPMVAILTRMLLIDINAAGAANQNDFSVFLRPDFQMSDNGSWWLVLAMASKSDDLRRLALDILIAAIEENRVDATNLAQSMAALHGLTVKKWVIALRECARVSPLHSLFCWQLLMDYICQVGADLPLPFLELILELREEHGFALAADAFPILKSIQGAGKAAKISKTLLAQGSVWRDLQKLRLAAQLSLNSRFARVQRWQTAAVMRPTRI